MLYIQREVLEGDMQKLTTELIDEIFTNIEHDMSEVTAYNRLIEFLLLQQKIIKMNKKEAGTWQN